MIELKDKNDDGIGTFLTFEIMIIVKFSTGVRTQTRTRWTRELLAGLELGHGLVHFVGLASPDSRIFFEKL